MKKLKTFLIKIFSPFANEVWWPMWSNIRWNKVVKDCEVFEEDRVKNVTEIRRLAKKLYAKFEYTKDGADQLFDAIVPPAQNYLHYLDGSIKDDCDGFHSLMYHCVNKSGFESYLLSVVSNGGGHCVLVFHANNKWHVNDYTTVHVGCDTLKEAVEKYNEKFLTNYVKSEDGEILYNGFIHYDYETGKFRSVKHELKELLK